MTDHPARDYSPRWSPDGRQIAFMREIDPGTALVLVMPAEGGTPRQIGSVASTPQGYTSHAIPRRALTWTPGSDGVITADSTGPEPPCGLVAISVRSSAKRELPAAGRDFASPLVSSDGREIAILQGGVAHTASSLLPGSLDGSLRFTTQPRRLPMDFPWVDSLTRRPGNRGALVSVASTLDGQRVLQFNSLPSVRKVSALRQRMIDDMTVRNFAPNTQESYFHQVDGFARHFNKSPEGLGPEEIREYQIYLAKERACPLWPETAAALKPVLQGCGTDEVIFRSVAR